MGFFQNNKFKLRQAFAKAGICAATALNITNSFAVQPDEAFFLFPFLALASAFYILRINCPSRGEAIGLPVPPDHRVSNIVETLSAKAGIEAPVTYMYDRRYDSKWKNLACIDTQSLHLDRVFFKSEESEILKSIIGHELSHKKNNDLYQSESQKLVTIFNLMTLALQMPNAHTGNAGWEDFLMGLTATTAVYLLSKYADRQQEFEADKFSVQLTGTAKPIVEFFRKLESGAYWLVPAQHSLCTKLFKKLTANHPSEAARINEVEAQERQMAKKDIHYNTAALKPS